MQPSGSPLVLKKAATEPEIKYRLDGKTLSIDDYLNRQRATGLLVLKDGEILIERYQYDRKSDQRLASHSMAKTVVSLALGIALGEGKIAALDDTAAKYAPAIAGSAYGETPLRHLLRMSSGVKFVEDYSGMSDLIRWNEAVRAQGTPRAVKLFNHREAEPGTRFQYASSETVIVTLALRGATGRTLCEWVTEKLWQPMGGKAKPRGLSRKTALSSPRVTSTRRCGTTRGSDGCWPTTGSSATSKSFPRIICCGPLAPSFNRGRFVPASWITRAANISATGITRGFSRTASSASRS